MRENESLVSISDDDDENISVHKSKTAHSFAGISCNIITIQNHGSNITDTIKKHMYKSTSSSPGVFKLLNEEAHTLGRMFLRLGCECFGFGWRDWERATRRWRDLLWPLAVVLPWSPQMWGLRGH